MSTTALRPLSILIVEDQFLPLARLKKLVKASRAEVAGVCRSLEDFRQRWADIEFDLAIIDLQLGKDLSNRDGWMVATEINTSSRPRPIIICSRFNSEELWRTVPRMNSVASMSKDAKLNEFLLTAYPLVNSFYPDAHRMFSLHPGGSSPNYINSSPDSYFFVKNEQRGYAQKINPELITMVKSMPGSKICIYYEDQKIIFSQSLSGFLKVADNYKLARVSDSTIVNFDYIDGKGACSVFVKTWGEIKEVSIGKAYAKNVEDWWRYLRSS